MFYLTYLLLQKNFFPNINDEKNSSSHFGNNKPKTKNPQMEKSAENSHESPNPVTTLNSIPICYRADYQKSLGTNIGIRNGFPSIHQNNPPSSPNSQRNSNGTLEDANPKTNSKKESKKSRSSRRSRDRNTRRKEPYQKTDRRSKYYGGKDGGKDREKSNNQDILQDLQVNLQKVGSYLMDISETLSKYM